MLNILIFKLLEVNKKLDDLQADFCKIFETKDPEQIVQFYHPHAVMIHVGRLVKYGRKGKNYSQSKFMPFLEIKEIMNEWLNTPAFPVVYKYAFFNKVTFYNFRPTHKSVLIPVMVSFCSILAKWSSSLRMAKFVIASMNAFI